MKVEFIDRSGFKNIASVGFPDRTACISISSTHEDWREMVGISKRSEANIKCLRFLDIDSEESGFTRRTAEMLKELVDGWVICEYEHRPKRILIHCDMGVSRSGAIAKWINDYYGLDDRYLNEYYQHNKYVYDTLMSVCGVSLKDWYRELEDLSARAECKIENMIEINSGAGSKEERKQRLLRSHLQAR